MHEKKLSQDRMKALKEAYNLTYEEIGQRAGLSKQLVWHLFNKPLKYPSLRTVEGIAKAFGCTVDDLAV